jgi:hypothetical protein
VNHEGVSRHERGIRSRMEVFGFVMLLFERHGGVIGSFLFFFFLLLSDTRYFISLLFSGGLCSCMCIVIIINTSTKSYLVKTSLTTTAFAQEFVAFGFQWVFSADAVGCRGV